MDTRASGGGSIPGTSAQADPMQPLESQGGPAPSQSSPHPFSEVWTDWSNHTYAGATRSNLAIQSSLECKIVPKNEHRTLGVGVRRTASARRGTDRRVNSSPDSQAGCSR
jgi:hypothetical protein